MNGNDIQDVRNSSFEGTVYKRHYAPLVPGPSS